MAALNTYRSTSQGVAYASGKSMLDVSQDTTGTNVMKCWRVYHFNNGTTVVTGVLTTMRVYRTTVGAAAPTGGSTVTPILHDTNNTALSSHVTSGTGRTITDADLFRQYVYSNKNPVVSSSTMNEWELFVPFAEVWNAGYADTNVQPLTARAAQGFHLKQQGVSAVGSADVEIEFSVE